mgnify:CR=1 FL=1
MSEKPVSPARSSERRQSPRGIMAQQVIAECELGEPFAISLVNVSPHGFLGSVDRALSPGARIRLGQSGKEAEVVRVADGLIACEFASPVDPDEFLPPRKRRKSVARAVRGLFGRRRRPG